MDFSKFNLIKHAAFIAALLLMGNPVLAKSDGWHIFNSTSLLKQAISADQKDGVSRFVILFVANWSIQSLILEKKLLPLNTKNFQVYDFFIFDVTQHQKDQVQMQNNYGLSDPPAVVVLDEHQKAIEGKTVCEDIWKDSKHFSEWLKRNSVGSVNSQCAPSKPIDIAAQIGINYSQNLDYLLVRFNIPPGFYIPYGRISLKLGEIDVEKHDVGFSCGHEENGDLYFKNKKFCKGKAKIKVSMRDLRRAGCIDRGNLILNYQKYNYADQVLFPPEQKAIHVDCE